AFLGPPEVNISSCLNCLNITVKLPKSHLRKNGKLLSLIDIYEELDYEIRLKTPEGEQRRSEKTTRDVFNTVLEELYPNRNYCVSITISASLNKNSIASPWKCATTDSIAQQDYRVDTIIGAVCFSLSIMVILICLYAGGFILQRNSLPHTLV
ncbi:INRA2 protein, partial [Nothoprocta pentlandii]|nr:INRA2 protein [Nothoprocta pentlandii]